MKRALPILILAATLASPVHAEASFQARSLDYEGGSQITGQLQMLFLADGAAAADALVPDGSNPPSPSTPWIDLRAAHAQAWQFSSTTVLLAGGAEQSYGEPEARTSSADGVEVQMSSFQQGFQLHLFSLGAALPYAANAGAGHVSSAEEVFMAPGVWNRGEATGAPVEQNPNNFALAEAAGPLLVHDVAAPSFTLTLHGDFVLEMYGLSLSGTSSDGELDWSSGAFSSTPQNPGADVREVRFVRVFLEDATLELASREGSPKAHWAAASATSHHDGPVTLQGATGTYVRPNGEAVDLRGGQHILPAGTVLDLRPEGQQMALRLDDAAVPTAATASLATSRSFGLVGLGAALALAAAVGLGLLQRSLRNPSLDEVEAAIASGRYRHAATLSRRVLRRQPGHEDAVLARAIALTKAGRHARAAAEVQRHLDQRGSSDGSLHYVLGLALLESGSAEPARQALAAAVRLTPSLATAVAQRLGGAFQAAPMREASAYA